LRKQDFDALYRAHLDGLFGFLVYRTGDRNLAEDLTAETFARAFKRSSRFDRRRGSEKTWLYTIALNLLRDHMRRVQAEVRALERVEVLDPMAADGATVAEYVARRDMIQRALAVLSVEERDAIALRFGAELTVPEIAEVIGEELTTADGRVYRALRKLRAAMAADAPEEEAPSRAASAGF
jgi:RNA polymerase sigma-70 factor (ECF subfamily)